MKITEFVKDNNMATFFYYRQKHLYYIVPRLGSDESYMFPIPIEDLGDATCSIREKAIHLMRYIRQALADGTLVLCDA